MPNGKDASKFVGEGIHSRIAIPSSFVANIKPKPLKGQTSLGSFRIAPGGWIIQAKATVRAPAEGRNKRPLTCDLIVNVKENATVVNDRTNATVFNNGYATMATLLGVRASGIADVEVIMLSEVESFETQPGYFVDVPVTLENLVLAGAKEDDLIVVQY